MKWTQKPEIIAAIISAVISGAFSVGTTFLAWQLQQNNAQQIKNLNQEVFRPRIIIESPYKDEETGLILPVVKGTVKGEIQSNYKILVGHRGITEQASKIHLDRSGEVLSDKSFVVDQIYLGSEEKGIGETFEIMVLLVSEDTLNSLNLEKKGHPLEPIPEHIAKSVTIVKRVK